MVRINVLFGSFFGSGAAALHNVTYAVLSVQCGSNGCALCMVEVTETESQPSALGYKGSALTKGLPWRRNERVYVEMERLNANGRYGVRPPG